mgnify:FL=1
MDGKRLCNHQTIKGLQNGLQKGIFYSAKGRLLHSKRAPLDLRVIKILTTHTTKGDY